jgi:Nif-specific regulatory protein|uniref:GAF domain-containing protein n=1 Tax=candidate division WOR-3 bacterium TaxID=2052148 RepID=A0A7C6E9W5_UNCW3
MTNLSKERLEILHNIATIINSIPDLKTLLERIMDLVLETLAAERGVIVLKQKDGFLPVVARAPAGNLEDIKQISKSVIEKVLATEAPLLLHSALEDENFAAKASVIFAQIKSVLACPLRVREKLIGAIYCDSLSQSGVFSQEDLDFLIAFACLAAIAIENAQMREMLLTENIYLKSEITRDFSFENIIGQSPKMLELFSLLKKVAATDVNVLIQGESGTGKELVAKAIHYHSRRSGKKIIPIYCGSLPETLLESELFGYKKGSFTGALTDKKGLIEEADEGTLFLDEVCDIPFATQAKLLRFLQEGEIRRIGETEPRKVDIRIIAATNRDLKEEVKKGKFRDDLYYRLAVLTIELPPLRERGDDVILLAKHFVSKYAQKYNKDLKGLNPAALKLIKTYPWPGNVRELENAMARAVSLAEGSLITPTDLRLEVKLEADSSAQTLKDTVKQTEKEKIIEILKRTQGDKTEAAKLLGISRRALYYKLQEYNIKDDYAS